MSNIDYQVVQYLENAAGLVGAAQGALHGQEEYQGVYKKLVRAWNDLLDAAQEVSSRLPEVVEFGDLGVGEVFFWQGRAYTKTDLHKMPRYGWVNCQMHIAAYEGDTGHRHFHNNARVETLKGCRWP